MQADPKCKDCRWMDGEIWHVTNAGTWHLCKKYHAFCLAEGCLCKGEGFEADEAKQQNEGTK